MKIGLRRFGEGPRRDICSVETDQILLTRNGSGLVAIEDFGTVSKKQYELLVRSGRFLAWHPIDATVELYRIRYGDLCEIFGRKTNEAFRDENVVAVFDWDSRTLTVISLLFE